MKSKSKIIRIVKKLKAKIHKILLRFLARILSLKSVKDLVYIVLPNTGFKINGEYYPYFFHSYNNFGLTERAIEIPIIEYYLDRYKPYKALEIGNVTNYYYVKFGDKILKKDVVDKIEKAHGVITTDIAEFTTDTKYPFVFSISSFEHMDSDRGRNEDYVEGESEYGTVAADNIIHTYENLLKQDGIFVITALLGYTQEWDETFCSNLLDSYGFNFIKKDIFRRTSNTEWQQVQHIDNLINEYRDGNNFPFSKYLSVIEIKK